MTSAISMDALDQAWAAYKRTLEELDQDEIELIQIGFTMGWSFCRRSVEEGQLQ